MSSDDIPLGAMNGAQLPERVPGHRVYWFGTLPPLVSEPTRFRRGDAATFIQTSRRLRVQGGT